MHLYGFVPASTSLAPDLRGIGAAPVRALALGPIAAWVSDVASGAPSDPALAGVQAHNAVLQSALDAGVTPLPARFGQRFADDARCLASIAPRVDAIAARLAQLSGVVEMTILISPAATAATAALGAVAPVAPEHVDARSVGAGRRYLEAVRARAAAVEETLRGSDEMAAELARRVSAYVVAAAPPARARVPVRTLSHLVRRGDADAYRAAARRTAHTSRFRYVVIGPRPPFSFSALADDPRGGTNLAG